MLGNVHMKACPNWSCRRMNNILEARMDSSSSVVSMSLESFWPPTTRSYQAFVHTNSTTTATTINTSTRSIERRACSFVHFQIARRCWGAYAPQLHHTYICSKPMALLKLMPRPSRQRFTDATFVSNAYGFRKGHQTVRPIMEDVLERPSPS
jgi:hypothetical protein